jgi:hypothetical protein
MDNVIRKLTAEQAFEVFLRLHRQGGKIRKAVVAEAMSVLTEIDSNEIGEEVLFALDAIDVEDCCAHDKRLASIQCASSFGSAVRSGPNG